MELKNIYDVIQEFENIHMPACYDTDRLSENTILRYRFYFKEKYWYA